MFSLKSLTLISLTSLAITANATTCVSQYYQCGGINWTGATNCCDGLYCSSGNDYWYACVTGTMSTSTTTAKANPQTTSSTSEKTRTTSSTSEETKTTSATACVGQYSQCGGINWTGATQCCDGFYCSSGNDYWYACATSAQTATAPTKAQTTTTSSSSKATVAGTTTTKFTTSSSSSTSSTSKTTSYASGTTLSVYPKCATQGVNYDFKCGNGNYPCADIKVDDVVSLGDNKYQVTVFYSTDDECPSLSNLGELKIIGLNSPDSGTVVLYSSNSKVYDISETCNWSATFVVYGSTSGSATCMSSFQIQYDWFSGSVSTSDKSSWTYNSNYDYAIACNVDNQNNAQADAPIFCFGDAVSSSTSSASSSSSSAPASSSTISSTSSAESPVKSSSSTSSETPTSSSALLTSSTNSPSSSSTTSSIITTVSGVAGGISTAIPSCASYYCPDGAVCSYITVDNITPLGDDEYQITLHYTADDFCPDFDALSEIGITSLNSPNGDTITLFSLSSGISEVTEDTYCDWSTTLTVYGSSLGDYGCTSAFTVEYVWFADGASTDGESDWSYSSSYDYSMSCEIETDTSEYCFKNTIYTPTETTHSTTTSVTQAATTATATTTSV